MAARYWTLVTNDLFTSVPEWPPTLRPVGELRAGTDCPPGTSWLVIEDDDAPDDLDGKEVDVTLIRLPGGMIAVERKPRTPSAPL